MHEDYIKPWAELTAIVFDFDGTLATCPYDFEQMRVAVTRVAAAYGLETDALGPDPGLLEMIDVGTQVLSGERAHAFRREATQSLCALEYEAAAYTVLLPGVVEALHALHHAGFCLGIITRNSAAAVRRIIGATVLPVRTVLSREDVTHPKPNPDHVHRMLGLLSSAPGQALMVGDHPTDIDVGKAAGMRTVAVLTGQTDEATLRQATPDNLFPSVVAMTQWLLTERRFEESPGRA